MEEKKAFDEKELAEAVLLGAQGVDATCDLLEDAQKAAKGHGSAADLAQNRAAFAHDSAVRRLQTKLEPALSEMQAHVDEALKLSEEAKQRLADCEQY